MRKKLMIGLLTSAVLWSTFSAAGAAGRSITIEAVGTKSAGSSILVKGMPMTSDVLVQVFRPNQSLMLTDLLTAAEYETGKAYTLPADAAAGTYSVIAGMGDTTAKTTFQVQSGQVTEPGGSNSGGSSSSPGSSSNTSGQTPSAGKGQPKRVTADEIAKQLTPMPNGSGGKLLRLEANELGIQFPADAIRAIGNVQVEVHQGNVQVGIPQAVLTQLTQLVSAEALSKAQIALNMSALDSKDVSKLLDEGSKRSKAVVKAAGEVYEFSLSILTEDGKVSNLSAFTEPLKLRLTYDSNSSKDLLGVYHVADNGELEYIGGHIEGADFVTDVSHFSKYAVLEYAKTFDDVPASYWANKVIQTMAAKHWINGVTDTEFAPENKVTRAEFAAILVRALELKEAANARFTDVEDSAWYAPYISAASDKGLINGRSQTEFAPNELVTREEMAVMIMRAYRYLELTTSQDSGHASFSDQSSVSSWAVSDVDQAYAVGLINGMDEGVFLPQGAATRAQSAQVIYKLLQAR
ncbi:S-layer homology domain-containing protein [Paenibacillus hexagrammi]|uniref:S-layer homology domain-containing protein n=1 Tax=Paenibacillus hexagrammi TaxID=2908839 RepID=A0ABY3SCV7_9BACL|nr:S-layer homology domain-containing protein [Paenibacillus sp. YPD9-1]UJF31793.1 S-layer homology domain-containing protein [Paenibacillus sp. YPD9-1]